MKGLVVLFGRFPDGGGLDQNFHSSDAAQGLWISARDLELHTWQPTPIVEL
jgi:hypothetical protein